MDKHSARRVMILLVLVTLLMGLVGSVYCQAGNEVIRVITASATSSSIDSTPVTDLLDPAKQGHWKPKSRDSGSTEGLHIQFQTPVLIDWISVKVKGFKAEWLDWQQPIQFYLDGQITVRAIGGPRNEEGVIAYKITAQKEKSDTLFRLGAGDLEGEAKRLRVKVKSVFITDIPFEVLSIRFYRDGVPGPLPMELPLSVSGEVAASSTLAPEAAYSIRNLFDSRLDFAWATDGKKSNGVGEQFSIKFTEPQTIAGLIVWNGYQRSETHYVANSRPSRLQVCVNGTIPFSLLLKDRMGEQYVAFPEKVSDVHEIAFSVDGVFSGSKYRDMVVSEIKLVAENGRIVALNCPLPEISPSNPLVARMVDMTWGSYMQDVSEEPVVEGRTYTPSCIRLRSNGSFVSHRNSLVMEGNWEETADGVRLFGKKYYTNPLDSAYLQAVKERTSVQIFQADVKIIDVASTPYVNVKKALQAILVDRVRDRKLIPPLKWWTGLGRYIDEVYAEGITQEELLKATYNLAVERKALLAISPLFIELMMPADEVSEYYFPVDW